MCEKIRILLICIEREIQIVFRDPIETWGEELLFWLGTKATTYPCPSNHPELPTNRMAAPWEPPTTKASGWSLILQEPLTFPSKQKFYKFLLILSFRFRILFIWSVHSSRMDLLFYNYKCWLTVHAHAFICFCELDPLQMTKTNQLISYRWPFLV